jgi:hypothetical protein
MWLGEKITEHGIGNGISLIIFVNILGGVPNRVLAAYDAPCRFDQHSAGLGHDGADDRRRRRRDPHDSGDRKIPVQYAKRVVGRRMYGGANAHPLRVNSAGVIPIISRRPDDPHDGRRLRAAGQSAAGLSRVVQSAVAALQHRTRPSSSLHLFYTAVVLNPTTSRRTCASTAASRHPAGRRTADTSTAC